MSDWPKHPNGRNKKIGEMTREESRRIEQAAGRTLQAEFNNPQSAFRRTCEAILRGPPTSRTKQ